jgi:hypothetical protein
VTHAAPSRVTADRLLFWLNAAIAGLTLTLCAVSLLSVSVTREANELQAGEHLGWTILGAVVFAPIATMFFIIAHLFRTHSRWRWIAQAAPVLLAMGLLVLTTWQASSFFFYMAAIALGVGVLVGTTIRMQARSAENDSSVPRGPGHYPDDGHA